MAVLPDEIQLCSNPPPAASMKCWRVSSASAFQSAALKPNSEARWRSTCTVASAGSGNGAARGTVHEIRVTP